MATLSTHILDTAVGLPAPNIDVRCEALINGEWSIVGEGKTDADGRVKDLHGTKSLQTGGVYRLIFQTAPYFQQRNIVSFYPKVTVEFSVGGDRSHYHVPLLLNPFGSVPIAVAELITTSF